GQAVRNVFAEHGFREIRTIQDYGQNDRVTLASLLIK
ncbi:peptide chain release factor N(5)-glutamine methyltransferase, partial [Acinetobacter baumannii]